MSLSNFFVQKSTCQARHIIDKELIFLLSFLLAGTSRFLRILQACRNYLKIVLNSKSNVTTLNPLLTRRVYC